MASEVLRTRERIAAVDSRLEGLLSEKREAEVVRSMPGMGVVPATRQSGASSSQRRARRGNRMLKRLMYLSSLSCAVHHAPSRAYYLRKRAEGKAHRQAVAALARRRVNVPWAMLRDGQPYPERPGAAA